MRLLLYSLRAVRVLFTPELLRWGLVGNVQSRRLLINAVSGFWQHKQTLTQSSDLLHKRLHLCFCVEARALGKNQAFGMVFLVSTEEAKHSQVISGGFSWLYTINPKDRDDRHAFKCAKKSAKLCETGSSSFSQVEDAKTINPAVIDSAIFLILSLTPPL